MPEPINSEFNPTPNAGSSSPTSLKDVTSQVARAGVNQIHGIAVAGSTGSGIPKAVTRVSANVANASAGATSTVTVMFQRDPTDKNFLGVKILAKGYQANNTPVQVGSSSDSPATFILNNTGESVSLIIQPFGNGGSTPLANCPSVGIKLPKSAGGGVGTTTTTQQVLPSTLTGDVTTAGSVATVVGLEGSPLSSSKPRPGDMLGYSIYGDSKWDVFGPSILVDQKVGLWYDPGTAGTTLATIGTGQTATTGVPTGGTGGTAVAASATDPAMCRMTMPSTASTSDGGWDLLSSGSVNRIPLGLHRRFSARLRMNNSANARYWFGTKYSTAGAANTTTFATDTLAATNFFIGFRFSAGTDSSIACVCNNNGTQTVVASGVAIDTAHAHLFEFAYVAGTVFFYIDGALVATISTNVPANTQGMGIGIFCDNKNTANAITLDVKFAYLSLVA